MAIAAPFVGRLADTVGLRRVIVGSAFLLATATALTATSTSLRQLILWRFLQGVVTPGIFAGSVAYMTIGAATAIGMMRAIDHDLEEMVGEDPARIADISASTWRAAPSSSPCRAAARW